MHKRLKLFYRLSTVAVLLLILCYLLVKPVIWFSSLPDGKQHGEEIYPITVFYSTNYVKYSYTTVQKQRWFKQVDQLLTPAVILLFVNIAVRLVKIPEIFKEND